MQEVAVSTPLSRGLEDPEAVLNEIVNSFKTHHTWQCCPDSILFLPLQINRLSQACKSGHDEQVLQMSASFT